jgi:hypothetical protein
LVFYLDKQGNQGCTQDVDLSKLNGCEFGTEIAQDIAYSFDKPLYGFDNVVHYHPSREDEYTAYAARTKIKGAAYSRVEINPEYNYERVYACYDGYSNTDNTNCILRTDNDLLQQQLVFPLTTDCEIASYRGTSQEKAYCLRCKKGMMTDGFECFP